ncbi:uncharacterized protein LOC112272314 [Brachypodium distachyon]|uniref:uncharacterized protein LOC112272314 n=1 Tax=Brachypodium distachyon TaxID=15368 RepID=UPI000D0E0616|nr:uncharacterized protein LOC112272314 [Brachypodium distachyon]XP_024318501.1 uncharacterized protein LOC112272314 [Brachypodium distachyon]XP_024318502.1 uncharacterized protein LOC112272314 [Brachypodium distachyon]XP_024318503.1 uncharacterized protein LOC112272314 [Brachypodium distachyon]|eukprot:XP_024318500.1 uncharacterized protein LOC112272314 [Brachypodium distachyon]
MNGPPNFGDEPPFTHVHYPTVDDDIPFGRQLATLCTTLHLAAPCFRGRAEPVGSQGGACRWEIDTEVKGRTVVPLTPDITYSVRYPNFMLGLQFAMQHAIARVCEAYHDELPPDSVFRSFERRVVGGNAMGPEILGEDPHMEDVQFQALEQNMVDMEKSIYNEMTRADIAEDQVGILQGQLTLKTNEVNRRGDVILYMHAIMEQIMYEKDLLQLQYNQLQAQVNNANLAPAQAPSPPQDQEMEPQEEEPQEAQEMDTPATRTRSRAKNSGNTNFLSLP